MADLPETLSTIRRLGWFGLSTSVITVGTFAVAYTTPPRSGPFWDPAAEREAAQRHTAAALKAVCR